MSVTISELKSRLSHYLRRVRSGETIIICDRDTVIARIEPAGVSREQGDEALWLSELERRGVVRVARSQLREDWLAGRPDTKAEIVEALLHEREESR